MSWHVAFEGPIAAGKTTIANLFAEASGAQLLLENFTGNEFLADFYKDESRWALPMQISFLLSRYEQFCSCPEPNVPIVADHTYEKDHIFAGLLLSHREFRLYETIHLALKHPVEKPNLIVYLDAPDEILLERIKQRNRPYETAITSKYLSKVRSAYKHGLLDRSDVRIIQVNTSDLDLTSSSDVSSLHDRIHNNLTIDK
jgi:deoxyadenosine/deoxycytidine kinase